MPNTPLDKLREITARNVAAGGAIYEQRYDDETMVNRGHELLSEHEESYSFVSKGEQAAMMIADLLLVIEEVFGYDPAEILDLAKKNARYTGS